MEDNQKVSMEKGCEALLNKDYLTARNIFRALRSKSPEAGRDLDLLDLLVQTDLHLEDLENSRIDARKMVIIDNGDVRGYLRCGQVCRLMHNNASAKIWYEQGLKHVQRKSEGYRQLAAMLKKLKTKIQGGKRTDPITALNIDIICMIWDYLDFRDKMICLRVSKAWLDTLMALPSLWRTVDLRLAKRPISLSTFEAILKRLPGRPSTLQLKQVSFQLGRYLHKAMKQWGTVRHLTTEIKCLNWDHLPATLKSFKCDALMGFIPCTLQYLLSKLCLLEKAELRCSSDHLDVNGACPLNCSTDAFKSRHKSLLPAMKHFQITLPSGPDTPVDFLDRFPNLETLRVQGGAIVFNAEKPPSLDHLQTLVICDTRTPPDWHLPRSIKHLELHDASLDRIERLPNLEHLTFARGRFTTTNYLASIDSTQPPSLKYLDYNLAAYDVLLLAYAGNGLSLLQHLRLDGSVGLEDEPFEELVSACPLLEDVEIISSEITGLSIKVLCELKHLQSLKLVACPSVPLDAVQYARARVPRFSMLLARPPDPPLRLPGSLF